MSLLGIRLSRRKDSAELQYASATTQIKAWKEQCRSIQREKLELEQVHLKQETELKELRKQCNYMRQALGQQNQLRENMANTENMEFAELKKALEQTDKSNPILQSVFYLLNRRLTEIETNSEVDFSSGLKLAFENGRCSALRAIKEDLLHLIADAGSGEDSKKLLQTRSPFQIDKAFADEPIESVG